MQQCHTSLNKKQNKLKTSVGSFKKCKQQKKHRLSPQFDNCMDGILTGPQEMITT